MGNAASWYMKQLVEKPLLTKAITSFIMLSLQERTAQHIVNPSSTNYAQIVKMGAYGFAIGGPLSHALSQAAVVAANSVVTRFLFTNLISLPVLTTAYLVAMAAMKGASPKQIWEALSNSLPVFLIRSWKIYPPFILFIQNFVPLPLWVFCYQLIGFVVGVMNNVSMQRRSAAQQLATEAEVEKKRRDAAATAAGGTTGTSGSAAAGTTSATVAPGTSGATPNKNKQL